MSVKWEPNGVYFSNNSNSLYKTNYKFFTPTYDSYNQWKYETTVTTIYDIGMIVLITYECTGNYGNHDFYNWFKINFSYGKWVIAIRFPYWDEWAEDEDSEVIYEEGYDIIGTARPGSALTASNTYSNRYLNFTVDSPIRVFAWRLE